MPLTMRTAFDIFQLSKTLFHATERNDTSTVSSHTKSLLALFYHDAQTIGLVFEKIQTHALWEPLNALFYLAKALYEASCQNNAALLTIIENLLAYIIQNSHKDQCIRGFFRQTKGIQRQQYIILHFLEAAAKTAASIKENLIFALFSALSTETQSHYEPYFLAILAESQRKLYAYLHEYLHKHTDHAHLTKITSPDTLLSCLIDYQADAISAIPRYSLRGAVARHLAGLPTPSAQPAAVRQITLPHS